MKNISFLFLFLLGCTINVITAQSDSLIPAMKYDSLAKIEMKEGNYAKADSLLSAALKIKVATLEVNHIEIANSYYYLGIIYWRTGAYTQAETILNKALKIRLEALGNKHVDVASTYNILAIVYNDTYEYAKAIVFHKKSLNIKRNLLGEKHSDIARSYINLGNTHRSLGEHEKALKFHNKALKINLELLGEKHPFVAYCYANLGNVYLDTGDYEKAITFHQKALDINLEKLGKTHPNVSIIYSNLGVGYYETGNYEKAITSLKKALNIKLEKFGKMHPSVADSYINLGVNYFETGNDEKAISLYNKALKIMLDEYGEKNLEVANIYTNLGITMMETRQDKKAITFHDKSLKIKLDILGEKHIKTINSYHELAYTYGKAGNFETADSLWHIVIPQKLEQLKSTYLFLPNDQRINYLNTFNLINKDFYPFVTSYDSEATKQLATNFLLNTKSLALDFAVSTGELIKEIKDTTLIAQYQQLNKLNKQSAHAEQLTSDECTAIGWNPDKIQEEKEALAFQMLQHPRLKSRLKSKTIKWQDIQNHLNPDEVTIDFLRVYEKKDSVWAYYGIVISKTHSSPQFIRIAEEKKVATLLKTDVLSHPYYIKNRYNRKALHQILWQPLESYLAGVKRVHLSPSELLHRVPFGSLQARDNQYLAEKYEIHYYSSTRDLLKDQLEEKSYGDMILMGHILYDLEDEQGDNKGEDLAFRGENQPIRNGVNPLPQTLEEVKWIENLGRQAGLKTTLLTIDAASEDNLQSFVQENAPGIFHFATHGVFLPPLEKEHTDLIPSSRDRLRSSDNPLQRSGIMLYGANETWTKGKRRLRSGEDGILTGMEVTALDLQNTGLVVLSACSSGLGKIHNSEGVFGLQRAFKLAGVNHVIASLWDVGDMATKELMIAFYNNLLTKKQHPVVALHHAKASLREAGYEPVDWAGFILIE